MKRIFIAFGGPKIRQSAIHKIAKDFECWNLNKFELDNFISAIKHQISPINKNVLRNYRRSEGTDFGLTDGEFRKCSWGLLLPDSVPDSMIDGYSEILFLLNLYSPSFLYPSFLVTRMGIRQITHSKNEMAIYHGQNQSKIFKSLAFVAFFKTLINQSVYASWQRDRCEKWTTEEWRLFSACLLYSELTVYENEKQTITWQRESADMATILEALFTADGRTNTEIIYRLKKRVDALIGFRCPNIESDITKLYAQRSAFVHGSFFQDLAKEIKRQDNASGMPLPDFGFLYLHKEYLRTSLIAYLNLTQQLKLKKFNKFSRVIDLLEEAIMDTVLRKKIIKITRSVLSLVPLPNKMKKNRISTTVIADA
ncbi:MAG: hypothetical protein V1807_01580 [Patescibacteria group bacterium]